MIPNTQWQYIIVMMEDGEVRGTNDMKAAIEYARNDQNMVICAATSQVMLPPVHDSIVMENIPEQTLYVL